MRRKKILNLFLFVLIGFITLGIGYAAISNVNLSINGTGSVTALQSNFDVKFLDVDGHRPAINPGSPNIVSVIDNTTATFDVSTLSRKGDTATATIDVKNESNGVGARIGLNLTNSNPTYFKVTEHITDTELQSGDITTVTVTIEMLKTPVSADETTSISAILTASPIDEATATGSDDESIEIPDPYVYSVTTNQINSQISNKYTDFNVIKTTLNHQTAIAHIINNEIITESYGVFERNNKRYYLRGGTGNEFPLEERPIYDNNVKILKKAFGPNWSDNCSEMQRSTFNVFSCEDDNMRINVATDGSVSEMDMTWRCNLDNEGESKCINY